LEKVTTLKCPKCGKEITGLTEKHAQRLLNVHMYVQHLQYEIPSEEDKKLLSLIKSLPKPIVEALNNENKRKLILGVLEGKVKTFKYLNDKPSWAEVLEKMKRFGIGRNETISELLKNWYEETEKVITKLPQNSSQKTFGS
jgi:oligoribonuclease NrnB/cAMP/cGMP phosphodiesterase (DHH superfamily)